MIFKRAVAKLRAQDWMAIAIELAIVVIGVFVGTQVSNWNQERIAARETRQLLIQLLPELKVLERFSERSRIYYATTGNYARIAFAGWRGDARVSDNDFIIAAYQASQIYGFTTMARVGR
jgi:predicted nucleic acid-binding protein